MSARNESEKSSATEVSGKADESEITAFTKTFEHQRSEDGFVFSNGSRIAIFKGDLAETMADTIVNSTGRNLNLSLGTLSPTLVEKAKVKKKDKLQEECDKLKPIQDGQVVMTDGFSLPCHNVLHVCCPSWGGESTEKVLRKIIGDCLVQAGRMQVKSIAFPALGTGILSFPRKVVARMFIRAVADFAKSNPNSSLKKIFIVIFSDDILTIEMFESALGVKINYQIQEVDKEDPVNIKIVTALPSTWKMYLNQYKEFPVGQDSDEWKQTEANFRKTIGIYKVKLLEVRRVQNPKAHHLYEVMKGNVAGELGKKEEEVEVHPMWHGSCEANIRKIARGKFDRGLGGVERANKLGAGVYFSTTSSYCCNNTFCPPNAAGERFMFQVRMVRGDCCVGDETMKQAPYKLGSDFKTFDSVVDSKPNPRMYAVFHDASAYPQYIIRYKLIN